MVKQTVCEKADEALSTYNEALVTNNVLQVKTETAKKRAANVRSQDYHVANYLLKHFILN